MSSKQTPMLPRGLISLFLLLSGCSSMSLPPSPPQLCLVPTGSLGATPSPRCSILENGDLVLCLQRTRIALQQCNADKADTLKEIHNQKEKSK